MSFVRVKHTNKKYKVIDRNSNGYITLLYDSCNEGEGSPETIYTNGKSEFSITIPEEWCEQLEEYGLLVHKDVSKNTKDLVEVGTSPIIWDESCFKALTKDDLHSKDTITNE